MSILMPLYTTGIVIFFVYTVMRIMFKKNDDNLESDDRSNRRLHQQLRSQAITPEFMQHQQRIAAAAAAVSNQNSAQDHVIKAKKVRPATVIEEDLPKTPVVEEKVSSPEKETGKRKEDSSDDPSRFLFCNNIDLRVTSCKTIGK